MNNKLQDNAIQDIWHKDKLYNKDEQNQIYYLNYWTVINNVNVINDINVINNVNVINDVI